MTINEIRATDKPFLTPAEVGEAMGADPQAIRVTARECPWRLGFPVSVVGTRTKIPRKAFLDWFDGRGRA